LSNPSYVFVWALKTGCVASVPACPSAWRPLGPNPSYGDLLSLLYYTRLVVSIHNQREIMLFIGKPIGRSLMISSTQSLETVATLVVIGTRHLTILFCKNCWLAGASGRKVFWEGKSLIVSMVLVQRGRFQAHQVGKSQTKPL